MADPYRPYPGGSRPARVSAGPELTCFTYLAAMVAGGFVAPVGAMLYNLYAELTAGTTLGMLIGYRGWAIPSDLQICLTAAGAGLLAAPLAMAIIHGLVAVLRRRS